MFRRDATFTPRIRVSSTTPGMITANALVRSRIVKRSTKLTKPASLKVWSKTEFDFILRWQRNGSGAEIRIQSEVAIYFDIASYETAAPSVNAIFPKNTRNFAFLMLIFGATLIFPSMPRHFASASSSTLPAARITGNQCQPHILAGIEDNYPRVIERQRAFSYRWSV